MSIVMRRGSNLRSLTIGQTGFFSDRVEVEVGFIHWLFVVFEAELDEAGIAGIGGGLLGRASLVDEYCRVVQIRC